MNPSTLSSLLFTLSLILFSLAPLPTSSTKLYEIVCRESGNDNDRCLKVLEADPRITSAKNYLELCKFILEMAIKRATKAQNYLKEVMKTNPNSPAIKKSATVLYNGVVDSFKSLLGDLDVDPQTANYYIRVADRGPTNCNNALEAEKIVNPSITTLNYEMHLLSFIAFIATAHIPSN